jgi:hypothetical protein
METITCGCSSFLTIKQCSAVPFSWEV